MIARLTGLLAESSADHAVIDVQGACPTSTPWPDDPNGPYPGPGQ